MKIVIELGPNLMKVALKAMSNDYIRPSFALREALNLDLAEIIERAINLGATTATVTIERE